MPSIHLNQIHWKQYFGVEAVGFVAKDGVSGVIFSTLSLLSFSCLLKYGTADAASDKQSRF